MEGAKKETKEAPKMNHYMVSEHNLNIIVNQLSKLPFKDVAAVMDVVRTSFTLCDCDCKTK